MKIMFHDVASNFAVKVKFICNDYFTLIYFKYLELQPKRMLQKLEFNHT